MAHGRRASAFWHLYASVYDAIWDSPITRGVTDRLLSLVPPGGNIADLGCGTGLVARAFVARGDTVVGVDSAPAMLRRAMRRSRLTTAVVAQADRTGLASSSAGTVLLCNVLQVAEDPRAVLEEAARIVGPGGRILLVWPTDAATSDLVTSVELRLGRSWAACFAADQLRRILGGLARPLGAVRLGEAALDAAVHAAAREHGLERVADFTFHGCQRVTALAAADAGVASSGG